MITVDPKPHGLILEPQDKKDWVFGFATLPADIVVPDCDWRPYYDKPEHQFKNGFESMSCVPFNSNEAMEAYAYKTLGVRFNASDRYGAWVGGTTQQGTSPKKFAENTRSYGGLIPEATLPFTEDITSFNQWKSGVTLMHCAAGVRWLRMYEVNYWWLWQEGEKVENKPAILLDAMKISPVCASVQAWSFNGKYYVKTGSDNHWISISYPKKKRYWECRDTYPDSDGSFQKRLAWDYDFGMAMGYSVKLRAVVDMQFYFRAMRGIAGAY